MNASRDPKPSNGRGQTADLVVVGAGVIGLSCAWRAAKAGLSVVVIERDAPGAGASGVGAGMLAPVGEADWGHEQLLKSNLAAAAAWPIFAKELIADAGIDIHYQRCGALHVALDRDEAGELQRGFDLHRGLGLESEWLRPRHAREIEPALSPRCAGAISVPGDGSVHTPSLVEALQLAVSTQGAQLRSGEQPTRLISQNGRVAGVELESGVELRAPTVVLATGAWAGHSEWLEPALRPAVHPIKGQIMRVRERRGAATLDRIVVGERVYLVPRPDGELVVGATVEEMGFDMTVTAGGALELLREAYRLVPEISEMELLGVSASVRPGTTDNLPIVGSSPLPGLLYATGHFRNGILQAPLAAAAITAELLGAGTTDAKVRAT